MVVCYGTLTDFGQTALTPYMPTLEFIPSGHGQAGSALLATKPVVAQVDSLGAWTVNLVPTAEITPERHYRVVATWLGDGGEFSKITVWNKLLVPPGGGDISTWPDRGFAPAEVWVGLEDNPPPAGFTGWWLVAAPGDPNSNTGSGDLRMVV